MPINREMVTYYDYIMECCTSIAKNNTYFLEKFTCFVLR